jgi:hypothetical protein
MCKYPPDKFPTQNGLKKHLFNLVLEKVIKNTVSEKIRDDALNEHFINVDALCKSMYVITICYLLVRKIYTVLISSPGRIPEMLVAQPIFAGWKKIHICNEPPLNSEILNSSETNKFM